MSVYGSTLLFLLAIILTIGCQGIDTSLVPGYWLADKVEEEGKELELDLSEISFEFKTNKRYAYYNTSFLSEDGYYEIRGTTLYTTDTTGNNPMKKAVQIIHISPDSLHIRMNAAGKEQILYLYRMKETPDELDQVYPEDQEEIEPTDTSGID